MDEAFGAVEAGDIEGTIELAARMNGPASVHEFAMRVRVELGVEKPVLTRSVHCADQHVFSFLLLLAFDDDRTHSWDSPTSELPLLQKALLNFLLLRPRDP